MSNEDSKKAWGSFQPVAHQGDYSGAAYMAPIILNDGAWEKIKETISDSKPGEFYTFDADGNGKLEFVNEPACIVDGSALTIGDTPEQLGTIQAADAIMIDGKIVTREDLRKLQQERNELAAAVEALRKIFPLKVLIGCDGHLNYPVSQYNDMVEAFNASPQQHLRDVLAEAGRAGFIAGADEYFDRHYDDLVSAEVLAKADNYAESVKAGEK